jgi:hypothetical protein
MRQLTQRLAKVAVVAVFSLAVNSAMAQDQAQGQGQGQQRQGGRGNFDPAQMQQRMMEMYKEAMEVTNADEWKIVEERIQKVNEARREVGFGGGRGFGGMRPPGNRGGDNADQNNQRRRNVGGAPNPAADELQAAIDSKASAEQLKAKLAKYRDDRKQKQANLEKAQEELKKVLNVRREAIAVMYGLLN